ncbi:MAG: MarR family transcriptional regulator [Deltaproteobacteria bacterium]|nr:MarR family transcriptional regulator [Deltaproteobacteria bacterium]
MDFMRLVWAVGHSLQRHSKRMASMHGVTGPQRLALRIVGRFPGITAKRLSQILKVHPSTVTCIVRGLERRKLITRTPDGRDSRRLQIGLTEKGREVDLAAAGTVESAVDRVLREEPGATIESARHVLSRLAEVLDRQDQPTRA